MLPLQHDREPGERRHICHRINFPLPGTWVSGAAPVCCTHTLMTSDRIQKLPIVGWWTPVKSFHTEIHTESDVRPLLKIDNDTTRDVCVWFLWTLVYLIYSLPFLFRAEEGGEYKSFCYKVFLQLWPLLALLTMYNIYMVYVQWYIHPLQ